MWVTDDPMTPPPPASSCAQCLRRARLFAIVVGARVTNLTSVYTPESRLWKVFVTTAASRTASGGGPTEDDAIEEALGKLGGST